MSDQHDEEAVPEGPAPEHEIDIDALAEQFSDNPQILALLALVKNGIGDAQGLPPRPFPYVSAGPVSVRILRLGNDEEGKELFVLVRDSLDDRSVTWWYEDGLKALIEQAQGALSAPSLAVGTLADLAKLGLHSPVEGDGTQAHMNRGERRRAARHR